MIAAVALRDDAGDDDVAIHTQRFPAAIEADGVVLEYDDAGVADGCHRRVKAR